MKSPVPYLTDAEYAALSLPERWLAQARSQVGVREATGHNDGEVEKYLVAAGKAAKSRLPYCAAGQYWCALQAGADPAQLPERPAAVSEWRKWATARGRKSIVPKRGRLAFWTDLGADGVERGHIGIVAQVFPLGVFRTIEFNTNGEGDREGDGVMQKFRSLAGLMKHHRWGFIDLEGLQGAAV